MSVNFPERLRSARTLARYTSVEMADFFGVSKRTYDYYEAGEHLGNEKKVKKLIEKLDRFEKEKLRNNVQGGLVGEAGDHRSGDVAIDEKYTKVLELTIETLRALNSKLEAENLALKKQSKIEPKKNNHKKKQTNG